MKQRVNLTKIALQKQIRKCNKMFILRTKSHLQIDILEQAWSSNKLVQC